MAQDAPENAPETIEVSASRISLPGFEAPTPVTVIGADKIDRDAMIDIGDLIRRDAFGRSLALAQQWRQCH